MNTEKIRVLLKTVECGSITAAAEELHFTPSGVSRTIESLEKDLGLSLLLRGPATRDANAMLSMVEAGLGIGMNNQLNIRRTQGKILTLPLDPPQIVEIGIAFSASLPPAAEMFYRRLQAAIPDFRSSVFEEHNIQSSDI